MYAYYNPNPNGSTVGDCVVRALTKALGKDWNDCYCELSAYGYGAKDMPSANHVWGKLLRDKGFERHLCDCDCTVEDFCQDNPNGVYILAIDGHVVCVVDGTYYDSWDSGREIPIYYWQK